MRALAALLCLSLTGSAWAGGAPCAHLARLSGLLRVHGGVLPFPGTGFEQAKLGVLLQRAPDAPDLSVVPVLGTPQQTAEAAARVLEGIRLEDLQTMPLDELDATARLIMDRLQGTASISAESFPDAVKAGGGPFVFDARALGLKRFEPRSRGRRVYLLPEPLEAKVELGPVARFLHYFLETAWQFAKAAAVWHYSGSLAAGLGLLAYELVKMPPMIAAQGLMDLELRWAWARARGLKELARLPGVRRIRVLNGGQVEFKGVLPVTKSNRGLVFLETTRILGETSLGTPILIDDLSARRMRLTLGGASWEPTLAELLEGERIPKEVADAWRAHVAAERARKTRFARLFTGPRDFPVEAELLEPGGGALKLGVLAQGKATEKLLRLRWFDALLPRRERSIPLLESRVRRAVRGAKDFLGRLSGRLIEAQ